jgi:hypothetical protein
VLALATDCQAPVEVDAGKAAFELPFDTAAPFSR